MTVKLISFSRYLAAKSRRLRFAASSRSPPASLPAFAAPRPKSANAKSTFKTTVELPNDVTLGGKTVSKGTYTLQADESKTTLIAHGKVVAEASSQWKDDKGKAFADNVLTDSGAIKEIRFGGKTRKLTLKAGIELAAARREAADALYEVEKGREIKRVLTH